MKTRVEQVTQTYEYTVYGCDECEFESDDQEDLERHIGKQHAVLETKVVGPYEFVRFENQSQYNNYLKAKDWDSYDKLYPGDGWVGPGWYTPITTTEHGRCKCGGCTDTVTYLWSANHVNNDIKVEIAQIRAEADDKIENLKKVASDLLLVLNSNPKG